MEMLKSLPTRWETYKQALVDAEEMLKKNKVCLKLNSFIIYFILINHNPMKQDRFKAKLLQQSEEFKKNVNELVNEFKTKGPFSSEIKPDDVRL